MDLREIIAKFRLIKSGISSRKKSKRLLTGEHKSPFKGAGFEVADISEWHSGESVRDIAWGPSLRTYPSKIYRIQRVEEKEMPAVLVVDLSSSMLFKIHEGANKARLMLELVGSLGFTSLHYHDPVGLLAFSEIVEFYLKPKLSRSFVYYMAKMIFEKVQLEKEGPRSRKTNWGVAINLLRQRLRTGSTIIFISDFVDLMNEETDFDFKTLGQLASRHNVVSIFLDDPEEFRGQTRFGSLRMRDMETDEIAIVPMRNLKKIIAELDKKRRELKNKFKKLGIDSIELSYGKHFETLSRFFSTRKQRQI